MARIHMKAKKRTLAFNLGATDIDEASSWLVDHLEESGVDKADRLRMRLLFEDALINMAAHFGAQQQASAHLEHRRRRYSLRITVKGERFNPLGPDDEGGQDDFSSTLFSAINMRVHYAYTMGENVLRLSLPQPSWNPVLKLAIALAAGLFFGFLGNVFIPDVIEKSISSTVLQPISDMWMRLLQAVSGPVIFLAALTATFGSKRIADFGGSRLSMLVRYFANSAIVTVFAMVCCWPFFPREIVSTEASGSALSSRLDGILQIVPGNLLEPFSSANTPQLLLIAIATGYILASAESEIGGLKTLISQLNALGLTVARYVCELVPFFVGLLLCLKIWTHDIGILGGIWLPLALSVALSVLVCLIALLVTAARLRLNPLLLARKLKGPFMAALKRGTLDFATVDDLADSCKRLLGIDGTFAKAVLPQGLFLYMPTSAVGICVFVLFAAQAQQISIDLAWLVSAVVISVVLAVATPPITGANLLSFIMAFTYLGISNDAILDVMVFDIVFGVICIAFDQTMLQLETIHHADRMGFLDEKALRAPLDGAA